MPLKMHPTEYGGWWLGSRPGDISGGSTQMQFLRRPTFEKYERILGIIFRPSDTLPHFAFSRVGERFSNLASSIHGANGHRSGR